MRKLEEEVEAGRRTLADHLGGAEQPVEILILRAAVGPEARQRVEEEFERPVVLYQSLCKRPVPMDVTIDQPRYNGAVGSVDRFRVMRTLARSHQIDDRVALDHDIARLRRKIRQKNEAASDDAPHRRQDPEFTMRPCPKRQPQI